MKSYKPYKTPWKTHKYEVSLDGTNFKPRYSASQKYNDKKFKKILSRVQVHLFAILEIINWLAQYHWIHILPPFVYEILQLQTIRS